MSNLRDAIQKLNKNTSPEVSLPVGRSGGTVVPEAVAAKIQLTAEVRPEPENLPQINEGKLVNPEPVTVQTMPTLAAIERQYLFTVLNYAKGNKSQAAAILGITIKTLYNKLHEYGEFQNYAVVRKTKNETL